MAKRSNNQNETANLGFEAKLWAAADALRNNMDAAEYKHAVLGLIFLKHISDAFEAQHEKLLAAQGEGAVPEDPDEYRLKHFPPYSGALGNDHLRARRKSIVHHAAEEHLYEPTRLG